MKGTLNRRKVGRGKNTADIYGISVETQFGRLVLLRHQTKNGAKILPLLFSAGFEPEPDPEILGEVEISEPFFAAAVDCAGKMKPYLLGLLQEKHLGNDFGGDSSIESALNFAEARILVQQYSEEFLRLIDAVPA